MRTHVYLGRSRDYARCGRYVGFHAGLVAITQERALEQVWTSGTAGLCGSCVRAVAAGESEFAEAVRAAREAARARHSGVDAKHPQPGRR